MKCLGISLMLFSQGVFVNSRCSGKDGLVCCSGTMWDKFKQKCVDCNPGYYGLNCSDVCQYPTYGKTCKFQCNCDEEFCDIALGCQKEKERVTRKQVSKLEGELVVSKKSRKTTVTPNPELGVSHLPSSTGKTFKPLSIEDIKRLIKDTCSDSLTWKLAFIIFASCGTCITLTIIFFIYKRWKPFKKFKHESDKTSSVGSEEYTECEMMELNIKTEKIIFEGLVNAKIGQNATQNAYAIQLQGICPNSEIDQNVQGYEIKSGNSPQICKSHLLSHGHGYIEPKLHDKNSHFLRKNSEPELNVTDVQMLASDDRNQYLIVTK